MTWINAVSTIELVPRTPRDRLLYWPNRGMSGNDPYRLRELDREHLIYDPPKPGPGSSGAEGCLPEAFAATVSDRSWPGPVESSAIQFGRSRRRIQLVDATH